MVSQQDFLDAVKAALGYEPYGSWDATKASGTGQQHGIFHDGDPLWILAGPGTGKTEVLVLRTLRLLLMDNVRPEAIMLTTFTERAARELQQRMASYCERILLQPAFASVDPPDLARLWVGTLHGLAGRILREFVRDAPALVQEEAAAFRFQKLGSSLLRDEDLFVATQGHDLTGKSTPAIAAGLRSAVNRLTEDGVDLEAFAQGKVLHGSKDPWNNGTLRTRLLRLKSKYERNLDGLSDFTLLQSHFLAFIRSDNASPFLHGVEGNLARPGLQHLIVDEYQDTNPIQEEIYVTMAEKSQAQFTVVGDDDQSLYRFRGASTDAMLGFDARCTSSGLGSAVVVELLENRRSHPSIVKALNGYMESVSSVAAYGKNRTAKSALLALSTVDGDHSPVVVLVRDDKELVAQGVAEIVSDLLRSKHLSDPRQAVILSHSTKVSIRKASFRRYEEAFAEVGLEMHNPRRKDLHSESLLKEALGSLSVVLDPEASILGLRQGQFKKAVLAARKAFVKRMDANPKLKQKIVELQVKFNRPAKAPRTFDEAYPNTTGLVDVLTAVFAFDPFRSAINASGEASQDAWRLAWLHRLAAAFDASHRSPTSIIPQSILPDHASFWTERDPALTAPEFSGASPYYIDQLYGRLFRTFLDGGFDEPEDELIDLREGAVPALTVHQSKGLGFSMVFIDWNQADHGVGAAHLQEGLFRPFRRQAPVTKLAAPEDRAVHDRIRQLFVAMSRAKYAVCLCMTKATVEEIQQKGSMKFAEIPPDWFNTLEKI